MSRRPLVAANWKMHGSTASIQAYLEDLVERTPLPEAEVVVCPPATLLPLAVAIASGSEVAVGAQNCHWEDKGAFTGEIAAPMLAELGVAWTIVGHSERRQHFGETDQTAASRARAAQGAGLSVIFCLGETLPEREAGETLAVLERQSAVLAGLDLSKLAVAYEPVWAIGTGRNATAAQAEEAHGFLRARVQGLVGRGAAEGLRILYGGSVKPDNAAELLAGRDVDGALVGGASLDAGAFWSIILAASGSGRGV